MYAMQYAFTLPADYDMAVIRRRIADKGRALDGFPGLAFKAYLFSDRADPRHRATANRYAPFYLWQDIAGASRFIESAGFAALADAFGRPAIRNWLAWEPALTGTLSQARWATLETRPLAAGEGLAALAAGEAAWRTGRETPSQAVGTTEPGLPLARLAALDAANWSLLRLSLWLTQPLGGDEAGDLYEIGYLAAGETLPGLEATWRTG